MNNLTWIDGEKMAWIGIMMGAGLSIYESIMVYDKILSWVNNN